MEQRAKFGTWIAASEKPPRQECYGEFWHSETVIVTDGKDIYMGYWESWDDPEYYGGWKLQGRDGYTIEGVTHWMYQPSFPNEANPACEGNLLSRPGVRSCPNCRHQQCDVGNHPCKECLKSSIIARSHFEAAEPNEEMSDSFAPSTGSENFKEEL